MPLFLKEIFQTCGYLFIHIFFCFILGSLYYYFFWMKFIFWQDVCFAKIHLLECLLLDAVSVRNLFGLTTFQFIINKLDVTFLQH